MVQCVVGAVADEEWQVPRPHSFPLAGVVRPHGGDIGLSVIAQALRLSAPPSGTCKPIRFANSSLSTRIVRRMIWSRSRPPPRGPLRISADTRAATASKNSQQACSSLSLWSSSVSSIGSCSSPDGENEMPQKSVEPAPTPSSTMSRAPAARKQSPIPALTATGRYRSRYDSSSSSASSGVFAPRLQPGQSTAKATAFFPLGPRCTTVRTGGMRGIVRALLPASVNRWPGNPDSPGQQGHPSPHRAVPHPTTCRSGFSPAAPLIIGACRRGKNADAR